MAVARLPLLTDSQRWGSGRNDQPGAINNLIFCFILNTNMTSSADYIFILGPSGFVFDSDCSSSLSTDVTEVVGSGNRWPPEYALWPDSVSVDSCVGSGSSANVTLSIATGDVLAHNVE